MQTSVSTCGSVKTVCENLTIEKLSLCECTATVVIYSHECCRGICYMTALNLPQDLQKGCWGVVSPWHSDFIAIVKRIRNEVVTTLVRSVRPGNDVPASDLRVGNDPCVWLSIGQIAPGKIVLSMLKTIIHIMWVAASVGGLTITLLQACATVKRPPANYMRSPNDQNSQQNCSWDRNSVTAPLATNHGVFQLILFWHML